MPVNPTYPGVYIDELQSQVHTIVGVPTSIAAFVGPATRGPVGTATHITSWSDFQRIFGGFQADSLMTYAVFQFYQNGGSEAEIVRIAGSGAAAATITLGSVVLEASSAGAWGEKLIAHAEAAATIAGKKPPTDSYNLFIRDIDTQVEERYLGIVPSSTGPDSLINQLAGSTLVTVKSGETTKPDLKPAPGLGKNWYDDSTLYVVADKDTGNDGGAITQDTFTGGTNKTGGIYALLATNIFNILCVPDMDPVTDEVATLCVQRRAMLLADPPSTWQDVTPPTDTLISFDVASNAAAYYPKVTITDPLTGNARVVPPSGTMAGVYARTDAQRGVWKAPAGTAASLTGVTAISPNLTDSQNGDWNQLGINNLRIFPLYGPISWGARTLQGADQLGSQWKYVPIRRLALFIEESLFRGTKWVVFEPNDEPLWSAIRLNVGAFMNDLFRQGAFQGSTPQQAYLVKCDSENNPQSQIDKGIVTITVGFAPLKPAEFVIIQIEQLAGQLAV